MASNFARKLIVPGLIASSTDLHGLLGEFVRILIEDVCSQALMGLQLVAV
jgi:hypothetical protein